ncbi:hypothetical protein OS493_000143 [Desmophyllum pertusum]|uniref:Uncharacterized protein n=1 Tax=Desmophyllum pertusum TaxID=174260 RepID=A0A9X0A6L2_9CNID|nr:hypothetical protein OS493_000143 [Desmophyllum pertusum]
MNMENVVHLLKLSDEFQVKAIFDPCVKFLEDQPKTQANVMKILPLADLYDLDNVSKSCNDLVKDMKLESLSEIVHLQDLDREKLQHFLTQRIERLETFLDTLYPQFMGLVACVIFLLDDHEAGEGVKWCSKHVSSFNTIKSFRDRTYRNDSSAMSACDDCRDMFISIAGEIYSHFRGKRHNGCDYLIDSNFSSVMEVFNKIKKG